MQVRFYAVGREIANCNEYSANAASVQSLRDELVGAFGARMGQLFDASSIMHKGRRLTVDDNVAFTGDDIVDVLPPFAGG